MFVIDDILLSPVKGFMWLVRELHSAAEREIADERERTMRALQSLHMRLEAGQMTEDEFEEREEELLDHLERLDAMKGEAQDDEEENEVHDTADGAAAPGQDDER
ncbi:MAG: gas vesicle protein GvpG [Planctomycetota bacterium]